MAILKKIKDFISQPDNYTNRHLIKYHLVKTIDKLVSRLSKKSTGFPSNDMFNWRRYHSHYRGELIELDKSFTLKLKPDNYIFSGNKLKPSRPDVKPLHPNWQLLYETIMQLNPQSVFELGCGNGMHLYNLQVLAPVIKLSGIDLSLEQLKMLKKDYPELKAEVRQADATKIFDRQSVRQADLAFTQAVIMHIHTQDLHLTALTNLFDQAAQQVILVERWRNHPLLDDINKLKNDGKIKWQNLFFYYRKSDADPNSTLMICSQIKLPYDGLTDYKLLPQS